MLDLLFPRTCQGCDTVLHREEDVLCVGCIAHLPLIAHHRNNDPQMKDLFYGRLPLQEATAMLHFEKKGLTQRLLHRLKYQGHQSIGTFFGKWLGAELFNHEFYHSIQRVIPVPLHPGKLKKRGYNQVDRFARQLAIALGAFYDPDVLCRRGQRRSQVFRSRSSRIMDQSTFWISTTDKLKKQHILLVDDVVTTGMTLELCGQAIWKSQPASLSLATIAIAS